MRTPTMSGVPQPLQAPVRLLLTTYRARGLRPADVVLASFPKSGSTWARFVLVQALSGTEVDFDAVPALSPPLGRQRGGPQLVPGGGRLVKSHALPRFLGPARQHPRVLFLARDGRDVAVSEYYHLLRRGRIDEGFEQFFPAFLEGRAGSYGTWHGHTRAWLDYAKRGSVHLLRYEDLLEDGEQQMSAVNAQLGLGLSSDTIADALRRNTAGEMRAKEARSQRARERSVTPGIAVVREARAGKWRELLTPQQCAQFEAVAGRELLELGYPLTAASANSG